MQAALYQNDNVMKIKCRLFGHGLTTSLNMMGILKLLVERCVNGEPSKSEIYRLLTARKFTPRYQKNVLNALKQKNRPLLTYLYTKGVLMASDGKPRPHFKRAMNHAKRFVPAQWH